MTWHLKSSVLSVWDGNCKTDTPESGQWECAHEINCLIYYAKALWTQQKYEYFYLIFIPDVIYMINLMLTQIYRLSYNPLLSARETWDWILGPWANCFQGSFLDDRREDSPSWVCTARQELWHGNSFIKWLISRNIILLIHINIG